MGGQRPLIVLLVFVFIASAIVEVLRCVPRGLMFGVVWRFRCSPRTRSVRRAVVFGPHMWLRMGS